MNKTHDELCQEVTMLRERLADSQTSLENALEIGEAANDIAQDRTAMVDLIANALGVPNEPHQGRDMRILEAAEKLATAEKLAGAKWMGLEKDQFAVIAINGRVDEELVARVKKRMADLGIHGMVFGNVDVEAHSMRESLLPRPSKTRRLSDQSVELVFPSCRLASAFEKAAAPAEGAEA